jgi:hypothetical protein
MLHTNERIIKHKVGLLNLAEELGNVAKACQLMGVSRDTFYREIYHTRTRVESPQTNGICERFHKTILQEFYQVTLRKKIYVSIEDLQTDLDSWLNYYNNERTHQGKMCCSRTPMDTLLDGKTIWKEKFIA